MIRRIAVLPLVLLVLAMLAAQAQALSLSGAIARPADAAQGGTTQNGANTPFHLHVNVAPGDDIKDITFEFPAGMTVTAGNVPLCPSDQFHASGTCPANTTVASGMTVGTPSAFPQQPLTFYNL